MSKVFALLCLVISWSAHSAQPYDAFKQGSYKGQSMAVTYDETGAEVGRESTGRCEARVDKGYFMDYHGGLAVMFYGCGTGFTEFHNVLIFYFKDDGTFSVMNYRSSGEMWSSATTANSFSYDMTLFRTRSKGEISIDTIHGLTVQSVSEYEMFGKKMKKVFSAQLGFDRAFN